jgi:hypothetical protein
MPNEKRKRACFTPAMLPVSAQVDLFLGYTPSIETASAEWEKPIPIWINRRAGQNQEQTARKTPFEAFAKERSGPSLLLRDRTGRRLGHIAGRAVDVSAVYIFQGKLFRWT